MPKSFGRRPRNFLNPNDHRLDTTLRLGEASSRNGTTNDQIILVRLRETLVYPDAPGTDVAIAWLLSMPYLPAHASGSVGQG